MKIKNIFLVVVGIFPSLAVMCQAKLKGRYKLTVDVSALKGQTNKIYFLYYNRLKDESVKDSAVIKGNLMIFKGSLDEPVLANLHYEVKPKQYTDKNNM